MQTTGHCFQTSLLASVPKLRAFAISLCGSREDASDLVQETLIKAWSERKSYSSDRDIDPWLFTILRNSFYSQQRKAWREVPDIDGCHAQSLQVPPAQPSHVELGDIDRILLQLPVDQREAFVLVCVSEMSYEEAAEYCDCPVGTIRSRVNRARKKLTLLLDSPPPVESSLAPDVPLARLM